MAPSKKSQSHKTDITKYHQPKIWQRELKRPPAEAVQAASIRMKETCDDPSGFCDLLVSDACQCPHLARWLPNMLDLNHVFCKDINGPRSQPVIMADPVHALHMKSQLEDDSTLVDSSPHRSKTSPWIYGEEQQRTIALSQAGVASGFFPLTTDHVFHRFSPPNPDAPKPLHADGMKSKRSSSSPTKTSSPSTNNSTSNKSGTNSPKATSPSSTTSSPSKLATNSTPTGEPSTKKAKTDSSPTTNTPTSTTSSMKPSPLKSTQSVSFASPVVASVQEIVEETTKSPTTPPPSAATTTDGTHDKKDGDLKEDYKKEASSTTTEEGVKEDDAPMERSSPAAKEEDVSKEDASPAKEEERSKKEAKATHDDDVEMKEAEEAGESKDDEIKVETDKPTKDEENEEAGKAKDEDGEDGATENGMETKEGESDQTKDAAQDGATEKDSDLKEEESDKPKNEEESGGAEQEGTIKQAEEADPKQDTDEAGDKKDAEMKDGEEEEADQKKDAEGEGGTDKGIDNQKDTEMEDAVAADPKKDSDDPEKKTKADAAMSDTEEKPKEGETKADDEGKEGTKEPSVEAEKKTDSEGPEKKTESDATMTDADEKPEEDETQADSSKTDPDVAMADADEKPKEDESKEESIDDEKPDTELGTENEQKSEVKDDTAIPTEEKENSDDKEGADKDQEKEEQKGSENIDKTEESTQEKKEGTEAHTTDDVDKEGGKDSTKEDADVDDNKDDASTDPKGESKKSVPGYDDKTDEAGEEVKAGSKKDAPGDAQEGDNAIKPDTTNEETKEAEDCKQHSTTPSKDDKEDDGDVTMESEETRKEGDNAKEGSKPESDEPIAKEDTKKDGDAKKEEAKTEVHTAREETKKDGSKAKEETKKEDDAAKTDNAADPESKKESSKVTQAANRQPEQKEKKAKETASSSNTKRATSPGPPKPKMLLSEARYLEISRNEEQIKQIRKHLAKRFGNTLKKSKKRKLESKTSANNILQNLPGALQYKEQRPVIEIDKADKEKWKIEKATAKRQVEVWLEQFRSSRRTYWNEQTRIKQERSASATAKASIGFSEWSTTETWQRTCQLCPKSNLTLVGDEIMQCLECSFIGCSPSSIAPQSCHQHILQHLFLSGHKLAVTCGARADIFCFPCGDFVFHKLFDQERERLDLETKIPWLAWSDHPLQRSFDPLQFVQVEEYGILWRGLMATYPPLVPQEHVDAARLCVLRQAVFEGRVLESDWLVMGRRALDFAINQNRTADEEKFKIPYPVGMYNLGNTCFMSSILQCLIHCPPLQRYFLKDIGHHHKACEKYRRMDPNSKSKDAANNFCLACEMDALMLEYYSRSTGRNVVGILKDLSAAPRRSVMDMLNQISSLDEEIIEKGEPMITSRMLHVAWKSGGMGHLAGYEQRDAHEFLHAFLDILGKQICQHRARVDAAIALSRSGSRFKREQQQVHHDVIKHLFEGKLRSVLVCQDCGGKRTLSEVFLNISLPLLKELVATHNAPGSHGAGKLSLHRCLEHFTAPETLADPVDCPGCGKKTQTKKQHTFSKLPKVLCVHLKRFHAALNRKIEDFVSFPAWGLNMGPHLPHWREVTTVPDKGPPGHASSADPEILYDLFGTVNHHGNLQSGHYVTNVKVGDEWFRCNDQHVSKSTEATVLTNDGAYILFYRRR